MKLSFFILFFFTPLAFGVEAIVSVLQAPLFLKEDITSPVIDYFPKGTKIRLKNLDVGRSDLLNLEDDLSEEMPYLHKLEQKESQFYQVYSKKGHEAFILKKHLFVYFDSTKEFSAKRYSQDGTDYRLEEPLPPNYPIKSPQWKRAWGAIGFGNLQRDEYNFGTNNLQTYGSRVDMTFAYGEKALLPKNDRLYFGVMGNFHYASRAFTFDDRTASEKWTVLGLGPYLSFDPWRGQKNRFTIYTSVLVDVISMINIVQQDDSNIEDAAYKSINIRPKIGAFYSWSQVFLDLDPIIGADIQMVRSVYSSKTNYDENAKWWPSNKLDHKMGAEFTLFFGIQKRI